MVFNGPHLPQPAAGGSRELPSLSSSVALPRIPSLDPAFALPPLPTPALHVSATTAASVALGLRRPRRRYEDIERAYECSWPDCTKSYGTLSHLNDHVRLQGHGNKREPHEFRELRRKKRQQRKLGVEANPNPLPPPMAIGLRVPSPPESPAGFAAFANGHSVNSSYDLDTPPRLGSATLPLSPQHSESMARDPDLEDEDDDDDDDDDIDSEDDYSRNGHPHARSAQGYWHDSTASASPRQTRSQNGSISTSDVLRPLQHGGPSSGEPKLGIRSSSDSHSRVPESSSIRAPESNLRSSSAEEAPNPNTDYGMTPMRQRSQHALPSCSTLIDEVNILAAVAEDPQRRNSPPPRYDDPSRRDDHPRYSIDDQTRRAVRDDRYNNNPDPATLRYLGEENPRYGPDARYTLEHSPRYTQDVTMLPRRRFRCEISACEWSFGTADELHDHMARHSEQHHQQHQQHQQQTQQQQQSSTSPPAGDGQDDAPDLDATSRRRKHKDRLSERPYTCSWPGCTKAYGKLDHLNVHVRMQRHGEKRTPIEFKHLRKVCRVPKQATVPSSMTTNTLNQLPALSPSGAMTTALEDLQLGESEAMKAYSQEQRRGRPPKALNPPPMVPPLSNSIDINHGRPTPPMNMPPPGWVGSISPPGPASPPHHPHSPAAWSAYVNQIPRTYPLHHSPPPLAGPGPSHYTPPHSHKGSLSPASNGSGSIPKHPAWV